MSVSAGESGQEVHAAVPGSAVLRAKWMAEIGASDYAAFLRFNRPQSVAVEQKFLDVVR